MIGNRLDEDSLDLLFLRVLETLNSEVHYFMPNFRISIYTLYLLVYGGPSGRAV